MDECSKSQGFTAAHINAPSFFHGFIPELEDLYDLRMELPILGKSSDLLSDYLEILDIDSRVLHLSEFLRDLDFFPLLCFPLFQREIVVLALLVGVFKSSLDFILDNSGLLLGKYSLVDKLLLVYLFNGNHLLNYLIHKWLGKPGLIKLVVTISSVSNQINNDIITIYLSIFGSNLEYLGYIVNAVSVNVENRSINSLS